ncbi:MAG TPA: 2-oxoacid:ferredoxin oxidoreductase subunit beta [Gemmatimonadales bacterium]|nr:2-oxoacid:ferredoxin oxidoreductase subunit beta [Gemmatimonadales bacterium]
MSHFAENPRPLTRKDFETEQEVRWCPGCGDYAILSQVQKLLPTLGIPRENFAIISGIGCSSRFPYYMQTYGMHSIHGRAPAIATGLKLARPELSVWVITGDGDALAIGGNHFIHLMRRNVDIKLLLLNNQIYGLTKGQYSPTSQFGMKTKTTPLGSIDRPFDPAALALAAGATFVARSVDVDQEHLAGVLRQAAAHRGTAFVEIYQNCVTFNDGTFDFLTDPETREDHRVLLEHGRPLLFGKVRDRGIRFRGGEPEVVQLGEDGYAESDCAVHDARAHGGGAAFLIAQLAPPDFPVPLGVFRSVEAPTYDELSEGLSRKARDRSGPGSLEELLAAGTTWTIA